MRRRLRRLISFGLVWGLFALRAPCALADASSNPHSLGLSVTLVPPGPPANITDLTATPNGSEGVIDLTWTEPGDDGYVGTASSYTIRVSSIANINNDADFDNPALAKPLSVFSPTSPPVPGAGGSLRVVAITGLEPGVTYYFAMKATDNDAPTAFTTSWVRAGATNPDNFTYATDLPPPTPTGLAAAQTAESAVTVTWNAVAAADLDFYRLSIDSVAPYNYADGWVSTAPKTSTSLIIGGLSTGTYAFRITAVDKGAPDYPGPALESAPSATVMAVLGVLRPENITDLVAVPGASEGVVNLTWTQPGDDGYVGTASSYTLRVSTIANINNDADFDNPALAKPLSVFSATPAPVPGAGGSLRTYAIEGLEPGATYYFAMKATDDDSPLPLTSAWVRAGATNPNNFAYAEDLPPAAPTGLAVAPTGISSFTVTWNASTAADVDYYRIFVDSTSPYDFADAWVVTVPKTQVSTIIGGLAFGDYAFRMTVVDKGAPDYPGVALESAPSATVMGTLTRRPAQTPYGIGLSAGPGTATVSWLPVVRYEDGGAFVDPGAPALGELSGYRVYRSTTPILSTWSQIADVSTATWSWTDSASGPEFYYTVRSENSNSDLTLSRQSLVRSAATLDAYSVAPDDQSYFYIPSSLVGPLVGAPGDPGSAYAIVPSSRPQDLGGRVYQSLEFKAYRGGLTPDANFSLEGLGRVHMHYEISGSSTAPSFSGAAADPQNASVYWWNGVRWLQLYGKRDTLAQSYGQLGTLSRDMFLETKYFGLYQVRSVERVTSFAFNLAGLSNRFVTPNGDGKNDSVVFTFDNPRDAHVRGRILDLRGRVVVSDLLPGPVQNSLLWDGTSNGRSVPGGVYIYQLEGEGQS
ncbi:MAG: hypothetical protein HY403_10180, partial [Elusimicrobia bacterium]|nr:hypothetical protein [Elusimicrobiota bacterium]